MAGAAAIQAPQYVQFSEGYLEKRQSKLAKIHSAESWICSIGASVPVALIGATLLKETGAEILQTDYLSRLIRPALSVTGLFVGLGLMATRNMSMHVKASPAQKKFASLISLITTAGIAYGFATLGAILLKKAGVEVIPTDYITRLIHPVAFAAVATITVLSSVIVTMTVKPQPQMQIMMSKSKDEVETLLREVRVHLTDAEDVQASKGHKEDEQKFQLEKARVGAGNDAYQLLDEVRKANELVGVLIKETPWIKTLERLENKLETQLKAPLKVQVVDDSNSSVVEDRIYIDPETAALIMKYEVQKASEKPKGDQRAQIREAIIRLFRPGADSIDKISQDLKIPTDKLEKWKRFAAPRFSTLEKEEGEQLNKYKLEVELISIADDIVQEEKKQAGPAAIQNVQNNNNL